MGYYSAESSVWLPCRSPQHHPMRPRELIVLLTACAVLGSAGMLLFAPETLAEERMLPPAEDPAVATGDDVPPLPAAAATVAAELPRATAVTAPAPNAGRARIDTSTWQDGVVCGDIQLVASVVDRIESIQIVVEELRNPIAPDGSVQRPWSRVAPVQLGIGTPTFELRGVPFSEYPYVVRVFSPGLNGSQATVNVTRDNPLVDDLKLTIGPGVPFTVLLRDQDQTPLTMTDVRLIPVGDPAGRPVRDGVADNYGSAVFEDVLAGDYDVLVGPRHAPLIEPARITVQPTTRVYGAGNIQAQGQTVLVPRGVELVVRAVDSSGYGLGGVKVRVQASDRLQLKVLEEVTDYSGNATFPHLLPGVWQIDCLKDGYQQRSRQVTVRDREPLDIAEFSMIRLR